MINRFLQCSQGPIAAQFVGDWAENQRLTGHLHNAAKVPLWQDTEAPNAPPIHTGSNWSQILVQMGQLCLTIKAEIVSAGMKTPPVGS